MSSKLTKKQKAFADEYITNGGNATQAAIKAGYSKKTARAIGKENLTKPNISEYINSMLNPVEKKREISADDALNELIGIWQGETQSGISVTRDNLNGGEAVKDIEFDYTPDLESKIKALDLYLKYKSLLSQTQIDKANKEIELLQAKLDEIKSNNEAETSNIIIVDEWGDNHE